VRPSPVKPGLQVHLKLPLVLLHSAFLPQTPFLAHSSISTPTDNVIALFCKYTNTCTAQLWTAIQYSASCACTYTPSTSGLMARYGMVLTCSVYKSVSHLFVSNQWTISRVAMDMDIRGYIYGYIHVWILDIGHIKLN